MTYDDLVQYYRANVPQDPGAPLGTEAGDKRFNSWTSQLEKHLGIPGGDFNDPASGWGNITPDTLNQFQTTGGGGVPTGAALNTTGGGVPLEQGLLGAVLPGLINDVTNDGTRRTISSTLANQAIAGASAANTQLARATGGHFDGLTYFKQNPDVEKAFNDLPNGTQPGTKVSNGKEVTADQFAEQHYLTFGKNEGRQPAYVQSAQLAQDFFNADQTTAARISASNQATQTQLAALASATTDLQNNLTGNLAAKAAALQQQLKTLNDNLDQLDATQRAALTQQITTQQKDLEESIATQRQALQDQITALGGAATTEAAAKRASLSQELQGLTAAEAPLQAARTAAAQLQATAVNTGLQRTEDQLTANNARAGYVGGSTGQDAALARASIDARQGAAQAMGSANVQNAQDTRDIGFQGASGERSIADALAQAQREIAGQGAAGNAALTGSMATQHQRLGDAQAAGVANITSNTALTRAGIGAYGANTTYGNTTTGADAARSIADALAQGRYGLTATNAQQIQAAQNQGAAAKATYYDNDWNRSLSAAIAPSTIAANTVGALKAIDDYNTSGLARTQNLLNWWAAPPGAAPTPGALANQPTNNGNGAAAVGNGLLGGLYSVGAANNWWQPTKPKENGGGVGGQPTPPPGTSNGD